MCNTFLEFPSVFLVLREDIIVPWRLTIPEVILIELLDESYRWIKPLIALHEVMVSSYHFSFV